MAEHLASKIGKKFDLEGCRVLLWETPGAYVEAVWKPE
jgi:hypothetical protein